MNERDRFVTLFGRTPGVRRATAWALVAALAATGSSATAQDATLVRLHDVRAIEAAGLTDPEGVDLRLHLGASFLDRLEPDRYDVPLERGLSFLDWPAFIPHCLGREGPGRDLRVHSRGGFLEVEAGAVIQSEVEQILADLEARLLRTIDLEVFVLPSSAVPPGTGAVLSAGQVDGLIASASLVAHASTPARLGERIKLDATSLEAVLIDYDVDVAEVAGSRDPQITVLREGIEIGAVVRAVAGGGFFLRAWGRRGEQDGPARTFSLPTLGATSVQQPRMRSALGVASATIPDGGGLLLGQDWSPEGFWLVRARSRGTGHDGAPRPFVPVGSLTAPPLLVSPPWLAPPSPSGGWYGPESIFEPLPTESRGAVFSSEAIVAALQRECLDPAAGGSLLHVDGEIYVRGPEDLLERTRETVKAWSAALTGTVELDLRFGLLERALAGPIARNEVTADDLVERLGRRSLGACRLGDCFLVVGGEESLYLKDYEVETAKGVTNADPIQSQIFQGLSFWCLPNVTRRGRIFARVDLALQVPVRETTQHAVGFREGVGDDWSALVFTPQGSVELPKTTRAGVRTAVELEDGEWTLLCCNDLAGTDRTLVAIMKAAVVRDL